MVYQFPIIGSKFSQYFTNEFVGIEALTTSEKRFIEKVIEKRAKDFSTGRLCARKALEELGLINQEILMGADKEPLWPITITGSISHSQKLTGAVVSQSDTIVSMGLDIETIGGIKLNMWDNLFLKYELDLLKSLDKENQDLYSTLLFPLKESFYKLQYPLTKTFLEFTDIELRYNDGKFSFYSDKEFINKMPSLELITVEWIRFEDQVITFCYLNR